MKNWIKTNIVEVIHCYNSKRIRAIYIMCLSRKYNFILDNRFGEWKFCKEFKANWKYDKSLPNNYTTCGANEYGYFLPKNIDSPLAQIYEKEILKK